MKPLSIIPVPQDAYVRQQKLRVGYYDCLAIPTAFYARNLLTSLALLQ